MWDVIKSHMMLILFVIVIANLPDIDYVPGVLTGDINAYHHGYTHTLGWVFVVSCGLWLCRRAWVDTAGWTLFALVLAVMTSHLLADIVTADGSFPYGIMIFWPISDTYFISPLTVFWKLMKEEWADVFQFYNLIAVAVEAVWGALIIGLVLAYKRMMPVGSKREPSASTLVD